MQKKIARIKLTLSQDGVHYFVFYFPGNSAKEIELTVKGAF